MYIPFGWRKGDKPELVWGSFLALLHFFLKVPNQQDQSSHSVRAQGSRPKTKGSKIPKAALLLRKLSCLVDIQHHHLPCHHALLVTVTQCNLNVITLDLSLTVLKEDNIFNCLYYCTVTYMARYG